MSRLIIRIIRRRHPGTLPEQILYCFTVYDLNDDGFISREEMLTMMGNCLTKIKSNVMEEEGEEEGVKDLIDMTIRVSITIIVSSSE